MDMSKSWPVAGDLKVLREATLLATMETICNNKQQEAGIRRLC